MKLELNVEPDLWQAEIDENQVCQAIHSLVLNAVQASTGGQTIVVEASNQKIEQGAESGLASGRYLHISVSDHGVGIPSKHLGSLFDPYFTTKQVGSGLGLTTAYSIVKKHGGDVRVRSKLGEGSTFSVFLPAVAAKLDNERNRLAGGPVTVLVMDDEEPIRKALTGILGKLGYGVKTCCDGEHALREYAKEPTDAVILDLTVPGGMGGERTLAQLREINPNVRAIVSSGYSENPVIANYTDYGFCQVLPKPYTLNSVETVLSDALKA